MNNNNHEINVDYIGVVSINNQNKAEYKQVSIDKCYNDLILKLDKASKDDSISLLDLQNLFVEDFKPGSSQRYYSYCYPYSYDQSYVGSAVYPQIRTLSEYEKKIQDYKDKIIEELKESCKNNSYTNIINKAQSYLSQYIYSLKNNFANEAIRYIKAFQYFKELSILNNVPINKMYSTETIGWTTYEYAINENIKFYLNSNFGYGFSSYFYVNLKYKDIDILPYSDIVKYYYANITEFIRYTRLYDTIRSSWDKALSFVANTTNQAEDEESFVKIWIINEIDRMISGLEQIARSPQTHLAQCINENPDLNNLISYRNISNEEKELYKIYPKEFTLAYQAEKISNSLLLLEKLKALFSIYPDVIKAIDKIIELNKGLSLKIEVHITNMNNEIKKRNDKIESDEREIEALKIKNKSHYDNINKIIQENIKNNVYKSEDSVIKDYIKNYPDFGIDHDKINKLKNSIIDQEKDLRQRQNFLNILESCIKRIKENLLCV